MGDLGPAIIGLVAAVFGTIGSLLVARRYKQLGLAPEQLALNDIRKQTAEAYRVEVERLDAKYQECERGRIAVIAQLEAERQERRAERADHEERIVRLTVRLEDAERKLGRPPDARTRRDD